MFDIKPDLVERKISLYSSGKFVIVMVGFSGLGYQNPEKVDSKFRILLIDKVKKYGLHNVLVVSGATEVGIGRIYEQAKNIGVSTLGIVAMHAKQYGGITQY